MRSLVDFRVNELSYAIFIYEGLELYLLYKFDESNTNLAKYKMGIFDFYL